MQLPSHETRFDLAASLYRTRYGDKATIAKPQTTTRQSPWSPITVEAWALIFKTLQIN